MSTMELQKDFEINSDRVEDIVISGVSCRLPGCDNIKEFEDCLINGISMVNQSGGEIPGSNGLPPREGKLKDLSKFDAGYFGINPKLADVMDPQLRMLLELTYETIVDSGIPPSSLVGTNTGVFIACGMMENMEAFSTDPDEIHPYTPIGCTCSMLANRLSFAFDFKGASYALRNGYSSGLVVLDHAVTALRMGQCDSAVVGGCNLCLKPSASHQLYNQGLLSQTGAGLSYDPSADGIVRSEGLVVLFLQKKSNARRVYTTVVHVESASYQMDNTASPLEGPSIKLHSKFLEDFYKRASVNPNDVIYVETSGCSIASGETKELKTFENVFCKNREKPLLIGSVASNTGHTETVSDLVGIAKLIIAKEREVIPLCLKKNPESTNLLQNGKIQIVSQRTRLKSGEETIFAKSSYGLGNLLSHVVLKSNPSRKSSHRADYEQRLFVYSSRTDKGCESVLNLMHQNSGNMNLQSLLNETAHVSVHHHPYRGYTIVNSKQGEENFVQKCEVDSPPVWFVFSGMGSQWPGMGKQMLQFEAFKESIEKCDDILQRQGLSVLSLLMQDNDKVYDSVMHSFVALTSIQIALVDMLKLMGVKPNGILGHSVGELGCGYADGSLTIEETVLAAYWRGKCVEEAKLPPGGMAAVGLTWEEAKEECPVGVVPACHNSINTVTVSGSKEDVSKFVDSLKKREIFAREVNSAGVAFHSRAMDQVAPKLKACLEKVIQPKPRSTLWVSSSVPESEWSSLRAKMSSADYIVNNLVSPVLFQEALQHIPNNACVIEVSPHCLLSSVLKRSLNPSCSIVGLMKKDHSNNQEFFLSSIGQCYTKGIMVNPLSLYPPVEVPVPRGTPMISPSIQWDHSNTWKVADPSCFLSDVTGTLFHFDVSPGSTYSFLHDHVVNGRALFPAAGYIMLAWWTLARFSGQLYSQIKVEMRNVTFHRAVFLPTKGKMTFEVNLVLSTGNYEIVESDGLVASGTFGSCTGTTVEENVQNPISPVRKLEPELCSEDIYKELRLKGYEYGPVFRPLLKTSCKVDEAEIEWTGRWIPFIDAMLQMELHANPHITFGLPTKVSFIGIDPKLHLQSITAFDKKKVIQAQINRFAETVVAGGIEMQGISVTEVPRVDKVKSPTLLKMCFVPYLEETSSEALKEYGKHCSNLACEFLVKLKPELDNLLVPNKELFEKAASTAKEMMGDSKREPILKSSLSIVLQKMAALPINSSFLQNAQSLLSVSESDLKDDQLISSMLQEDLVKSCLDIVVENLERKSLRVLEVCKPSSKNIFLDVPLQHLKKLPFVQSSFNTTKLSPNGHDDNVNVVDLDFEQDLPESIDPFQLIVLQDFLHDQKNVSNVLNNASKILSQDGCLLLSNASHGHFVHLVLEGLKKTYQAMDDAELRSCGCYISHEQCLKVFAEKGYRVIAEKSDNVLFAVYLLRQERKVDMDKQMIVDIDGEPAKWFGDLKNKFAEIQDTPEGSNLWLISDNKKLGGTQGLVRCLRREPGGHRVRCVVNLDKELRLQNDWLTQRMAYDLVMNVYKDQTWGSYRHLQLMNAPEIKQSNFEETALKMKRQGELHNFYGCPIPSDRLDVKKCPSKELCHVYFTAVNLFDEMVAVKKKTNDNETLCMEFAGKTSSGRRVMGIAEKGALATSVLVDKNYIWDVPETWSLQEAATVLWAYGLAIYVLHLCGEITKECSLLVRDGVADIGQAAITLALDCGSKVYSTVKSLKEQDFLHSKFDQLPESNIFIEDTCGSFEFEILRMTKGKGVDIILNSQTGDNLQCNLRLLRLGGKLLELNTQLDSFSHGSVQEGFELFGVRLEHLRRVNLASIETHLTKGIKRGVITPLDYVVYPASKVADAFHVVSMIDQLKPTKVLVQMRNEENDPPWTAAVPTVPVTYCSIEKSYIITGGLGGFGIELADWLIQRGATKLLLTSRSGVKDSYQARKLLLWKERGVHVEVCNDNVATEAGTEKLIKTATNLGPVGGVFHLAMVLKDGMLENQTVDNFDRVFEPKVSGAVHLDRVTRNVCSQSLDWFVVFSSVSSGYGNPGQTNYGFANSAMELLCEQRKQDGLPGLAIQWGAIGDVGVIVKSMGGNTAQVGGTLPQKLSSCLDVLDQLLNQSSPIVTSYVPVEYKSAGKETQKSQVSAIDSVLEILGIENVSSVNPKKNLMELGLDSLMMSEIKQKLKEMLNANFTSSEIQDMTVEKMQNMGLKVS